MKRICLAFTGLLAAACLFGCTATKEAAKGIKNTAVALGQDAKSAAVILQGVKDSITESETTIRSGIIDPSVKQPKFYAPVPALEK